MSVYYNENDPKAAAWLRALIAASELPAGDVDERSIIDVRPFDLMGYAQHHFFAGIGGWPLALRLAGWPDDRPVWTGSCPCQPLSGAGKRKGHADERHLWPVFHALVAECGPPVVFGEQVASKDGREWLAAVRLDLEDLGYAVGAADLCAAGVGAPHIRQRLYWGARRLEDAELPAQPRQQHLGGQGLREQEAMRPAGAGVAYGLEPGQDAGMLQGQAAAGGLADADRQRQQGVDPLLQPGRPRQAGAEAAGGGEAGGLADAAPSGRREERADAGGVASRDRQKGNGAGPAGNSGDRRAGEAHGGWGNPDWLFCRDGKFRPVEPGTFPLVDGAAARVGRLRGYGNAIVPQVAAAFIAAWGET